MAELGDESGSETDSEDVGQRGALVPVAPSRAAVSVPGFAVGDCLGSGPIGSVFRAVRSDDSADVVLKLLSPNVVRLPSTSRRLQRLIVGLSQTQHAHLSRFLGAGHASDGTPYLCFAYVHGAPLTHLLRTGPLTVRRLVQRFAELLSALSEAHRVGVVHLGVRPSNVLVTTLATGEEQTRVCDLGVDRLIRPPAGSRFPATHGKELTAYLSPEQVRGEEVDGRTDIFGVGTLLYVVLTGVLPAAGDTPEESLERVCDVDPQPPRERSPERGMPRELEAICLRALRKLPQDRFRTALEMSQALRAALEMLGSRADLPLGPTHFGDGAAVGTPLRSTLPGDQLRSHVKLRLGTALLLAACAFFYLSPVASPPTRRGDAAAPPTGGSTDALARARKSLKIGDFGAALGALPPEDAENDPVEMRCARAEALVGLQRLSEARLLLDKLRGRDETSGVCPGLRGFSAPIR